MYYTIEQLRKLYVQDLVRDVWLVRDVVENTMWVINANFVSGAQVRIKLARGNEKKYSTLNAGVLDVARITGKRIDRVEFPSAALN